MPSSRTATAMSQESSGSAPGCKAEQRFAQLAMWVQSKDIVGRLALVAPGERRAPPGRTVGKGPSRELQGSKPVIVTLSQWAGPLRSPSASQGSLPASFFTESHRPRSMEPSWATAWAAHYLTMKAPGPGKASRELLMVARSPVAHET